MESARLLEARPGWLSPIRVATSNAAAIVALVFGVALIAYDRQATAVTAARKRNEEYYSPQDFGKTPRGPDDVERLVRIEDRLSDGEREAVYNSFARHDGDVIFLVLPEVSIPLTHFGWVTEDLTDDIVFRALSYVMRTKKLPVLSWQWVSRAIDDAVRRQPVMKSGIKTIHPAILVQAVVRAARLEQLERSDWSRDVFEELRNLMEFLIKSSVSKKLDLSNDDPEESSTQPDESFKCVKSELLWVYYVRHFVLSEDDKTRFCDRLKTLLRKHFRIIARKEYESKRNEAARKPQVFPPWIDTSWMTSSEQTGRPSEGGSSPPPKRRSRSGTRTRQ